MLPEQILSITGVNKPGMFPCDPAVISALIDVLPLRLYVKDLERRFTYANKATIDAHKMGSMDQILGKKDEDFLGARSAEEARIDEEVLLSTGVPVLDKEVLDDWRDGVSTWSLVCKKPIVNDSGQIVGLLGMSKDITATKKDQIRFKLAVDSSGEGLWHRNLITGETWFSDRMMEIYGYDPQRIPSEVSRWRAVHPKHRKEVAARLRDCIEGRTPKYDCQFQVRGSDGAYRWIQARGVVLRFESKAVEFAGAHADITATKNLELSIASRLQESLARLAQEQQTFNLSRIAIELSHDFKTLIHGALIQLPVVISKLARKTAKA